MSFTALERLVAHAVGERHLYAEVIDRASSGCILAAGDPLSIRPRFPEKAGLHRDWVSAPPFVLGRREPRLDENGNSFRCFGTEVLKRR